jgi:hypothetical protein
MRIVAIMNATKIKAPAVVGLDKTIERANLPLGRLERPDRRRDSTNNTADTKVHVCELQFGKSFGSGTRHYSMSARRTAPMVVVSG